jgi:RNA polymerase sigma factor (TIGR02999 family)
MRTIIRTTLPGPSVSTPHTSESDSLHSPESLLALLYGQLRAAAQQEMKRERAHHTLTATALVHEAWMRLQGPRDVPFERRGHFYAAVIQAMRRVLLDHAKARGRQKRGGGRKPLDLDAPLDFAIEENLGDYVCLDEGIERLRAHDARMAEIVRLRFFAGLSVEETAKVLGVSARTVKGDWAFARRWLRRDLSDPS